MTEPTLTFSYSGSEYDGAAEAVVASPEYLPTVLREFGLFLRKMGFTNIREVTADYSGVTHTSKRI